MAKVPTGWKKWRTSNIRENKESRHFKILHFMKPRKNRQETWLEPSWRQMTHKFFWKLLESFLPEMKIIHQKPVAFNVAHIKPKSFFLNAFFWKFGGFWKFQNFEKPISSFLFRPPVFLSPTVTDSINCHVSNFRQAKPRFLTGENGKEQIMPDKRGLIFSALFMDFP